MDLGFFFSFGGVFARFLIFFWYTTLSVTMGHFFFSSIFKFILFFFFSFRTFSKKQEEIYQFSWQ